MEKKLGWHELKNVVSTSYRCGYCGESIASDKGYIGSWPNHPGVQAWILICHRCTRPTFIDDDNVQYPGSLFGDSVKDVSDVSVDRIYAEARRAYSASAYTGSVLCCRKLLMHIAVAKGAKAGDSFASYVEFYAIIILCLPMLRDGGIISGQKVMKRITRSIWRLKKKQRN